jgi:glycosyltransferase involved in cell wall biosynthesis
MENKMKILFITPWYPNENNPVSGVFVKELANAVSIYCEVEVLHSYPDSSTRTYMISDEIEEGVRIIRVRHPKLDIPVLSYISYLFNVFKIYKKFSKDFKPDVIHAHVYLSGILAIILGRCYRIPVIVTEHAEIIDKFKDGHFRKLINIIKIILAKFALKNAQLLVLVSKSMQEHIEKFGIKNRCIIIPNVVNTEIFHPSYVEIKNKNKKLLFVGGLTPIKGIPYMLEAIKIISIRRSDFFLEIIGDGNFKKEYEKLAKNLRISGNVRFYGRKNKEEIAEFMKQCDFLILPSLYETFGVVLIEAMACGKPVISTLSGGQKEFINDDNGILVLPKNSQALAEAIEYMLDNYQNYSSDNISRYIRERFSYNSVGKLLNDTYLEVYRAQYNKIYKKEL